MAVASSRLQTSECGREHSLPEAGMLVPGGWERAHAIRRGRDRGGAWSRAGGL